jgi:hypothetical protein
VRKGKTYALLNDHASKKRKLDNAAFNDQKGAYENEIHYLRQQVEELTQINIHLGG